MSQLTPATVSKKRPQRRTLQSGFSLLARGEPKIWLTGGMLVICLAMILSLISLIAINGLATFWPQPVEWLVLSKNEMDIGEPQRTELRPIAKKVAQSNEQTVADAQADRSAAPPAGAIGTASQGTNRFYRTANFDITGRHYRWFEAGELNDGGIVRPEWALVIERLSWGRLLALPSRLALPLGREIQSTELEGLEATHLLLQELAAELEALPVAAESTASSRHATASVAPANEPAASDATAASDLAPAAVSPVARLSAEVAARMKGVRSQQLHQAMAQHDRDDGGTLQLQTEENGPWAPLAGGSSTEPNSTAHNSANLSLINAARVVWHEPMQILDRIQPVLVELAGQRRAVEHKMRAISRLDQVLSDARVAVRQAELDTDRSVLEQVDSVGPLIDRLLVLERLNQRLTASGVRSPKEFQTAELATAWRNLSTAYHDAVIEPGLAAVNAELDTWRQSFADEPSEIRDAVADYEKAWREVLARKQPLEEEILADRARIAGHELSVIVPSDAVRLGLSADDTAQLKGGKWSEAAQNVLQAQSIKPLSGTTMVAQLTDHLTQVNFDDPALGRMSLWGIRRGADDQSIVWLLPQQRAVNCDEIVRLFPANRLSVLGKLSVYGSRWYEFLLDDPREANTEGGVFPAIWGTVVMTLIMTLAVVPFGVIAALYLREYTRSGPIVSLVRISINNLAGVPSIVYGVFGLAFFCYSVGAFIDGGATNADFGTLPAGSWYAWLATTVLAGVVAFMLSLLSSGPEHSRSTAMSWLARVAPWLWMLSLVGAGLLIFRSPFFNGLYEARLPTPTFGKEGLLWASLTLALLTLPVVIVATEEALSAVPNSLREGSLACGASKWQTIYRIVLPHARPGILTGAILAMARGIGEVAPLMLVGALPVAPDLPLDSEFPYFHGSRSFMHLGYQIYWLGFQSQNSEASKPLVFTCTLLLILIVVTLNLSAILLRARLRRRFQGNQF